jgi:hypothetical protein
MKSFLKVGMKLELNLGEIRFIKHCFRKEAFTKMEKGEGEGNAGGNGKRRGKKRNKFLIFSFYVIR